MADPRIHVDEDRPVLNRFGKPVFGCAGTNPEDPCCDECNDWMDCLLHTYYSVSIPGIEFSGFLANHWLSSNVLYKAEQGPLGFSEGAGESTTTFAFEGEFLAEPRRQDLATYGCEWPDLPVQGVEDQCDGNYSHMIRELRTVLTNSPEPYHVKHFGLRVKTECVVEEGVKYLRFTLLLFWEGAGSGDFYEEASETWESEPVCPPKEETPWAEQTHTLKESWCCPIATSDLIDLSTIDSLADLSAVVLHKAAPLTAVKHELDPGEGWGDTHYDLVNIYDTTSQACLQLHNLFGCCVGIFQHLCDSEVTDPEDQFYWQCNPHEVEQIDCETLVDGVAVSLPPSESDPAEGPIQGCSAYGYWNWAQYADQFDGYCGHFGESGGPYGWGNCGWSYCISPPLEFGSGDIILKVFDNNCESTLGCKTCMGEGDEVATPIPHGAVRFESTTPFAECTKTLVVIKPDCVTLDKVYWSDGVVTNGDESRTYNPRRIHADDITGRSDELSAVFVTTGPRVCFYCWAAEIDCGCCEGATGSLSYEIFGDEECHVRLTANIPGDLNCPNPFITIAVIGGNSDLLEPCSSLSDYPPECACDGGFEHPYDGPCEGYDECVARLYDGETYTLFNIDGCVRVKYRVTDSICGCDSDEREIKVCCMPCDVCTGSISLIKVNISGITAGEGGCTACTGVNGEYWLHADGVVNTCSWKFTTVEEGSEWAIFCCSEFDCYGVEIFLNMSCGEFDTGPTNDPLIPDSFLSVAITAGGIVGFVKYFEDTNCPEFGCSGFTSSFGVADQDNHTNGACNFDFASVDVTVYASE